MPEVNPDRAFLAYGRAMAKIGGFEQIMRLALGEHEIRRAQAAGDATRERLKIHANRLLKLDFGQLTQRTHDKFKLPPPWREILKDAKQFRNYLAHEFWSPNYGNLRSERGINIIAKHCELIEHHFDVLATGIIEATGVNIGLYIQFVEANAGDEETFRGWETRLQAGDAAIEAAGLDRSGGKLVDGAAI